MQIYRRSIDTAELVTIDGCSNVGLVSHPDGKFIRLRPEASDTDHLIKCTKEGLLKVGARSVRVLPRPPIPTIALTKSAMAVSKVLSQPGKPSIRKLMEVMINNCNSQYKPELHTLVQQLADEEGL